MGLSARQGEGRSVTSPRDNTEHAVRTAERTRPFVRVEAARRRFRTTSAPHAPSSSPRPRVRSLEAPPTVQPQPADSGALTLGPLAPLAALPPVVDAPDEPPAVEGGAPPDAGGFPPAPAFVLPPRPPEPEPELELEAP